MQLSRDIEIDPAHAALLFIDVQNYNAGPDGGEFADMDPAERDRIYAEWKKAVTRTFDWAT